MTWSVHAGPVPATLPDGTPIHVDRFLSRSQLDVLAAVLDGAGVDTGDVVSVTVSEVDGWSIELLDRENLPHHRTITGRTLVVPHR